MRDRAIEVKVGILVLLALGVLAGFIFVLGNFSLSSGFSFFVDFDFSGNLQVGAPVKVAGIKVGKVDQVAYLGGRKDGRTGRRVYVRVQAWVENRVQGTLFSDAEFFVNTQGVLGEQYLEIVPGSPGRPPIAPGQILVGVTPPRMDLVVARLFEMLDGVTRLLREDKETIHNLLRSGTQALRTIDGLLLENRQEIGRLLAGLERLSGEAGQLVQTLNAGLGPPARLRGLLASLEKTTASVSQSIDGLLARTSSALDGVGRVAAMVGPEDERKIRRALDRLLELSESLVSISGDARVMVAQLSKGKGTAGALLVREELYEDIKEMVRDLKRNPWKFLWRE